MRIGFLLGAGVSLPAGMPSTDCLTRKVMATHRWARLTGGTFVPRTDPNLVYEPTSDRDMAAIAWLLGALRERCQTYFDTEKDRMRRVNYEDLFYAADQISEHITPNYENPILEPVVASLLAVPCSGAPDRQRLGKVAELAGQYIQDVVSQQLLEPPTPPPSHLTCMVRALKDDRFDGADIFTLNHDKLIEETLRREGIPFADGFGPADGDVCWWKKDLLDVESPHYLLKLHGSVDWFHFEKDRRRQLARCLTRDSDHPRDKTGRMLRRSEDEPRVLIGTFNKVRDYFAHPYFDLVRVLRRQLGRIAVLFVSGYSFGDKGVNTVLTEWVYEDRKRKLICLSEEGAEAFQKGRGAVRNAWDELKFRQMLICPKYLHDCGWAQLVRQYLSSC